MSERPDNSYSKNNVGKYFDTKVKKVLVITTLLLTSNSAFSASYSNWAVPTAVEIVSNGVLIHGAYGDPTSCGKGDYIFVSAADSFYNSIFALALSAVMGKREMQFYSNTCTEVGFHWSGKFINQNFKRSNCLIALVTVGKS